MRYYLLKLNEEQHQDLKVTAAQLDMSIKDLLLRGAEKVKEEELNSSAEENNQK